MGIFGQIQLDVPQVDSSSSSAFVILLQNLEVDVAFLQQLRLIDGEPHRDFLPVVPRCLVLNYIGLVRAPAVLRRIRAGEMPSNSGGSGDQRDVGEIDDAKSQIELGLWRMVLRSAQSNDRWRVVRGEVDYPAVFRDCEGKIV